MNKLYVLKSVNKPDYGYSYNEKNNFFVSDNLDKLIEFIDSEYNISLKKSENKNYYEFVKYYKFDEEFVVYSLEEIKCTFIE